MSDQGIEAISDTPRPSTGEKYNHLGRIHQARHSNNVKNPTAVNLYALIISPTSREYHDVTSKSCRLTPEYSNLHISGLIQIKRIQYIKKKGNGILKVFVLIYLFTYVVMSATN